VRALKAAAVLRVLQKDPRGAQGDGVQQQVMQMKEREVALLKGGPEKSAGPRSLEEHEA
jgi:hypothetical protein